MHRVFVYGTLKRGHGNNRLLAHATLVGRYVTQLPLLFKCLGGFPGLVRTREYEPAPPPREVGGEVWEVNDEQLESLDWLEGHPSFYERQRIRVAGEEVWTYILPPDHRYMTLPDVETPFWRQTEAEAEYLDSVTPSGFGA